MRRSRRWLLLLVLLTAMVFGALVGQLLFAPLKMVGAPRWIFVTTGVACALIEFSYVLSARPRPFSVNQQVPQTWGYLHGPWRAAFRYGIRMGFGPATMLNTWNWWLGALTAASTGLSASLVFALCFAGVRAVLTVVVPGVPTDGLVLARRMEKWIPVGQRLRFFSPLIAAIAAGMFAA